MFHSKRSYWRKLDNAAKLFPATSNKKDTRVFRFYCIMKEDVKEEILQQAVEKALEKYPLFLSVMRKGLFWHYLEKSNLKPVVTEEFKEPCSNLYVRDKKSLLFEVTYYKRRINFEVFHVLTDGTSCNQVGGLSGAFIPVSEDEGMIAAVQSGHINLEKLEAMTAICSVGLDMIAIPADTPDTTIAAMIADEAAIGVINQKTTAVRIIPYGKEGDMLELGGLLGYAPVMKVNKASSADFIARGGQIPAPVHSFKN